MPQKKQARWQKVRPLDEDPVSDEKVFDRVRGLKKPGPRDSTPILLEDELPHDFYFPASLAEVSEAISTIAGSDSASITHVYLRRAKSSEFRSGRVPFAEYVRAEGICLIAVYPWPTHLQTPLTHKPGDAIMNRYKRWAPQLQSHKAKWSLKWHTDAVRNFFLDDVLKSIVLCHVEIQRASEKNQDLARRRNKAELFAQQRYFEDTVEVY